MVTQTVLFDWQMLCCRQVQLHCHGGRVRLIYGQKPRQGRRSEMFLHAILSLKLPAIVQ